MELKERSALNAQIYEEACEWFLEFRSDQPDPAARGAFDRWIRRSPEHLAAYMEVAAIWNEGPSLDPHNQWDAATLIRQAAHETENVVPLTPESPVPALSARAPRGRRYSVWKVSIAASLLLAISAAALYGLAREPIYSTAIGEQRSIALADGSTVELNARSKLKVRYSDRERSIELIEGQALFTVARETDRPFVVTSGVTRVRAIGTQFDVYRKSAGVTVTVLEGRVALDEIGRAGVLLSAGEQAIVTPKEILKAARPNVASATAWTERQLVFDSASIAEVAEEFNRYNSRQLIVRDPALYDFHISGVFSSADPASLIRFLRERPGVRVTQTAEEIRVEKYIP